MAYLRGPKKESKSLFNIKLRRHYADHRIDGLKPINEDGRHEKQSTKVFENLQNVADYLVKLSMSLTDNIKFCMNAIVTKIDELTFDTQSNNEEFAPFTFNAEDADASLIGDSHSAE